MNQPFFYIIGTHCCGKTSLIRRLHQEAIIDYAGTEIGKDLYYQEQLDTKSQKSDFEHRVARMELQRDNQLHQSAQSAVVETWHPGNLAYALLRNPEQVDALCSYYHQSPLKNQAIGIWLTLSSPEETITQRTKTFASQREWAATFYGQMQEAIGKSLSLLGLQKQVVQISADPDFGDVYDKLKQVIGQI